MLISARNTKHGLIFFLASELIKLIEYGIYSNKYIFTPYEAQKFDIVWRLLLS
jgi:hypothetical protein